VSSSGDVSFVGDTEGAILRLSDTSSVGEMFSVGVNDQYPVLMVTNTDIIYLGKYQYPAITVSESFAFITGSLLGTSSYAITASYALNGASVLNTVVKTTSYTLTTNDYLIICSNPTTPFTITLISASSNLGRSFIIKNNNDAIVTIDGTGVGQIDGSDIYILNKYQSLTLVSDGTTWNII